VLQTSVIIFQVRNFSPVNFGFTFFNVSGVDILLRPAENEIVDLRAGI